VVSPLWPCRQVGGRIVSKRLQALIEAWAGTHVLIEAHADRVDPSHTVSHRIQESTRRFIHDTHLWHTDD
jgi:2-succinyl-5-enolpyruvyl-6-hydroxy-3-cyclohexene-1-carboxylate synthase